ncbi:MAG: amidohydrolase family protein, partial [Vallitaleaceae bacterium]|nr:amidohydrolase family protein [Vallitaleaceae bacterium]
MKVLKNVCFYDFKNFERQAYIVFDEHILKIGKMKDFDENAYKSTIIIDAENHLVMPSLVVGHTHLYATLSRGLSVPFNPNDFKELLQQLWWRIDAQLEEKSIYASGLVGAIDYVKNGVTTLIDHHASGLMIEGSLEILKKAVVEDVGLRGAFCFETSDRFDIDACIRENESFILNHAGNAGVYDEQSQENHANYQSKQSNPSDRINPSKQSNPNHPSNLAKGLFGAHAMLTLSEVTLRKIKAEIGDTPLHIHVAESLQDEKECVRL